MENIDSQVEDSLGNWFRTLIVAHIKPETCLGEIKPEARTKQRLKKFFSSRRGSGYVETLNAHGRDVRLTQQLFRVK